MLSWFVGIALALCMVAGLAGGWVHRKSGSLSLAAASGLLPLIFFWVSIVVAGNLLSPVRVTLIDGKTYTPETLPKPPVPFPAQFADGDPAHFEQLKKFGLDESAIELCRREGCTATFAPNGGIEQFGPSSAAGAAYVLDTKTSTWKLKP